MFRALNTLSRRPGSWLLLLMSTLLFEAIALYFQYGMGLKPCVLCIYQRCAIFGIMLAGLICFISPSFLIVRLFSLAIWLYSAWRGLSYAMYQTKLQLDPSPFMSCDLFVQFPDWLPLNTWLPQIFEANGDCSDKQWSFLSWEMPQWMIVIFAAYLLIGAAVLISQLIRNK